MQDRNNVNGDHNRNVGSRNAYNDYAMRQQIKATRLLEKQQRMYYANKEGLENENWDLTGDKRVGNTGNVGTHGERTGVKSGERSMGESAKGTLNKGKARSGNNKKSRKRSKSKRTNGMTYSQKKRASYNYRSEYFKRNPGIFGNIWFCSQCGKILVGKHNVVIDHIVPLNSVAGVNRSFNTVAICQSCNSKKSDIIDYRIAKGYLAKIFEVFTSHLPDLLALVLSLMVSLIYQIFNLIFLIFSMLLNLIGKGNAVIVLTVAVIFLFFYFRMR